MTQNIKRGLGDNETRLLSTLMANGKEIFTVDDAVLILDISRNSLDNLLYKLAKRKWILRIQKGKYLIIPLEAGYEANYLFDSFLIASFLIEPYYIGYWSALNFYGLTEQVPLTVFIASTKRKRDFSLKKLQFCFIKISSKKFFGLSNQWILNKKIKISDKEKTIIDCLDHPEYCGGIVEVAKGLWYGRDEFEYDKMLDYALMIGNRAVVKRLGYLCETVGVGDEAFIDRLRKQITRGYSKLDPNSLAKGEYKSRWNLYVNLSKEELTEWSTH
jgi:predicted transcriptional regulator of viral defense system